MLASDFRLVTLFYPYLSLLPTSHEIGKSDSIEQNDVVKVRLPKVLRSLVRTSNGDWKSKYEAKIS